MIIDIIATVISVAMLWAIFLVIGYFCTWLHPAVTYGIYAYTTISATKTLMYADQHAVLGLVPYWILFAAHVAVLIGIYSGALWRTTRSSK